MTQIITTNIEKGGVGKTTITVNGAAYLAKKCKQKILLIDFDPSSNLTNRFLDKIPKSLQFFDEKKQGFAIDPNFTVKRFFDGDGNPDVIKINDKIDLIAGFADLYALKSEIEQGRGRYYLMNWLFSDSTETDRYDYILIDTHNDNSIITDNALAIADKILAVVDVDGDSMEKIQSEVAHIEKLKQLMIEPQTGKSYVNAEVVVVGNKVNHTGKNHQIFKSVFNDLMTQDAKHYLGYFPFRDATFGRTKTENAMLVDLEEKEQFKTASYRQFFKASYQLYDKVFDKK
jgi:chromosome partitioning protein